MKEYDLAIIGSGPGGYVAGLRSAQAGLKTVVIEKDKLGGVCLNRGCIPTKTLLESARQINSLKKIEDFGIKIDNFRIDIKKIWERKEKIVENLRKGIEYLFKARKVDLIKGEASFIDKETIVIKEDSKEIEKIKAKNIIIATGSSPLELPNLRFDHEKILSSDDVLEKGINFNSLIIVGGGVIGCEFASLFSSLGIRVTIVELLKRILPQEDEEISSALELNFKKKGINVLTERKVERINLGKDGLEVILSDDKKIEAEKILVCVGRKPNSGNLGLENLGINLQKGWIVVDDFLRTNISHIFALGDVVGKTLLAHVAMFQGERVIENIKGEDKKIDYRLVPNCIYTFPEIASIGIKEKEAKEWNLDYAIGKFPFRALGKAHTVGETEGFLKVIIDRREKTVLGAYAFGPEVTNIIAELVLAIRNKIKIDDILETIHAHPTFSEIIPEAIFSALNFPLHIL